MGLIKQMQMEEHEREYNERIAKLQQELDELYPDEDWDAEDYEAYCWAMDKDD